MKIHDNNVKEVIKTTAINLDICHKKNTALILYLLYLSKKQERAVKIELE